MEGLGEFQHKPSDSTQGFRLVTCQFINWVKNCRHQDSFKRMDFLA